MCRRKLCSVKPRKRSANLSKAFSESIRESSASRRDSGTGCILTLPPIRRRWWSADFRSGAFSGDFQDWPGRRPAFRGQDAPVGFWLAQPWHWLKQTGETGASHFFAAALFEGALLQRGALPDISRGWSEVASDTPGGQRQNQAPRRGGRGGLARRCDPGGVVFMGAVFRGCWLADSPPPPANFWQPCGLRACLLLRIKSARK